MAYNKKLFATFVLISLALAINVEPSYAKQDWDWCKDGGICNGYTFGNLNALSYGNDDIKLFLPKDATYKTIFPFCAIYEYDSWSDDDASWRCTWEKDSYMGDGLLFKLWSLNPNKEKAARIKAVAVILDANVFSVNEWWDFETSSRVSAWSSSPGAVDIFAVDTYYTNGDDDFTYSVYFDGQQYHAITNHGNDKSYIKGKVLSITPPNNMFFCQDYLYIRNNDRFAWDSLSSPTSTCRTQNLSFTNQEPLIIPSLMTYDSVNGNVDKDFAVKVYNHGMEENNGSNWASADVGMKYGNEDSVAWIQMTVIGYR